jgi:two-component system, cell cycle response regulator DivK
VDQHCRNPAVTDLAPSHERPAPSRRRGPGTVLIVDDIVDVRELYAKHFRSRGFRVITARDGVTGIVAAERSRPDLIVMDLSMPGLDGITATARLKKAPQTRHVPILILTGYPLRAVERGAFEAGPDGFLTKPCLPEDLETHVRRLLDRLPA